MSRPSKKATTSPATGSGKEIDELIDLVTSQESMEGTTFLGSSFTLPLMVRKLFALCVWTIGYAFTISNAYRIRLFAIQDFGRVIHEFDPWFNYRATVYLSKHGWNAFFHWFDYMSWYPLGRPVGSTIYPGLQITSVVIHRVLRMIGKPYRMTLNDVCCFVPAWFGAIASVFLGLLAYECSGSGTAGMFAAMIMAIIPAHIMRSVGGGYDNESIAITAMCCTFYLWVRSLRSRNANTDSSSWMFGILTGLSYGYMVAAWGGFVFVINMIALHAGVLVLSDWFRGYYSSQLYYAYSLFYVIGTAIAVCVPPVAMMPFKSLEQLSGLLVFLLLQTLHLSEKERVKKDVAIWSPEGTKIRLRYFMMFVGLLTVAIAMLWPTGFFGPLSSRIRGLFVKHMKTGNPLVDSVSEHQPASADAFWHYLHVCSAVAPMGLGVIFFHNFRQSSFIVLLAMVVYFFATKMARLIILASLPAAALTGIFLGYVTDRLAKDLFWKPGASEVAPKTLKDTYYSVRYRVMRLITFGLLALVSTGVVRQFVQHCEITAHRHSNPKLMFKVEQQGRTVIIDDYREAYHWLRDNTPEDSRVLAWWDYGYQITGIANRTTIADGNTWNHEHIATIGRCLTSPVPVAHRMIRHLADYVLVWAGGGGDDLGKSPWMARIGNSVYRDICPKDPLCEHFGFNRQTQEPTPMMAKSLLYNLHSAGKPGVGPDGKYFQEAHTSPHGLVRIFKVMNISEESKKWVADPANRVCDAPGSWYCVGKYPPAEELQEVLRKRRSFSQLEDFNKKSGDNFANEYLKRSRGE